jgi:hypothetical protein
MYLLAHLLAGILIGIFLTYLYRDARLILASAFGSILPDLVDKPVGLILLAGSIGYGRIYCHTLLFAGVIIFLGILVYTKYPRTGLFVIAMAAGIFSHQLLDAMWLQPVNWFWPALGPFKGHAPPDFFWDAFLRTIKNPTEWLAGTIIIAFLIIYLVPRYRERFFPLSSDFMRVRLSLPLILLTTAIVVLTLAILFQYG